MKRINEIIKEKQLESLETNAKHILALIGEDIERTGLLETPKRIAKMWLEVFKGYDKEQEPKITVFPNKDDGINYNQIIIDEGIFFSHCEHHMAVFHGQYFFGYIPDGHIIGLSKIARLVEYYSAKLQVQERLGEEILNHLETILRPKGMILIMKAKHTCKMMRGIKKDGQMTTSIVRGVFESQPETRAEFLTLINLK